MTDHRKRPEERRPAIGYWLAVAAGIVIGMMAGAEWLA